MKIKLFNFMKMIIMNFYQNNILIEETKKITYFENSKYLYLLCINKKIA